MKEVISQINSTYDSYQRIIKFYQHNKDLLFDNIDVELKDFFAANMSAVLGAVLDLLTKNFNDIHLQIDNPKTELVLQKNDFLTYYGKNRSEDINHTTITFQKLKPTDGKFFKNYVVKEFIGRNEFSNLSEGLKEKIVEAIYEIFVNAQIHSETEFIYTCGQFFPNKDMIEFTLVDTGIGFKNRINRRFNSSLSAEDAIQWAVQDRKTTKETTPGGIGLALLKEFVEKNGGKMQIVSDSGFFQFCDKGEEKKAFVGIFPGTIVNLCFRTNDSKNYSLQSEIDLNKIF